MILFLLETISFFLILFLWTYFLAHIGNVVKRIVSMYQRKIIGRADALLRILFLFLYLPKTLTLLDILYWSQHLYLYFFSTNLLLTAVLWHEWTHYAVMLKKKVITELNLNLGYDYRDNFTLMNKVEIWIRHILYLAQPYFLNIYFTTYREKICWLFYLLHRLLLI